MPTYDYHCEKCNTTEERMAHMDEEMIVCTCGGVMHRLFSPPSAIVPDIVPYWEENLGPEPVYVESRKHLNQLCRERGVLQKNALSHKEQRPQRWI